jgi:hypothetical protein
MHPLARRIVGAVTKIVSEVLADINFLTKTLVSVFVTPITVKGDNLRWLRALKQKRKTMATAESNRQR